MSRPPSRVVIYGAGAAGLAAQACLSRDRSRSVVAFVDSDVRKQGTAVGSLPVLGPAVLADARFDDIVIASHAWR